VKYPIMQNITPKYMPQCGHRKCCHWVSLFKRGRNGRGGAASLAQDLKWSTLIMWSQSEVRSH